MTASITVQQDRSTPTALLHSPGVRLKASDHLNAFCVHARMHTRIHFLLVVHFISTHLESSSCSNKVRFSSQVTDRSRQFRYFFPSFINTRFPLHLEHQLHTHTHTHAVWWTTWHSAHALEPLEPGGGALYRIPAQKTLHCVMIHADVLFSFLSPHFPVSLHSPPAENYFFSLPRDVICTELNQGLIFHSAASFPAIKEIGFPLLDLTRILKDPYVLIHQNSRGFVQHEDRKQRKMTELDPLPASFTLINPVYRHTQASSWYR